MLADAIVEVDRNRVVAAGQPPAHHRHGDGVEHAAHRQSRGARRRVEAHASSRTSRCCCKAAIEAQGRVGHHAERAKRATSTPCSALLPALQRPTISPLSDDGWVAVNTIIEERTVRDLIPQLKAARRAGHRRVPAQQDRGVMRIISGDRIRAASLAGSPRSDEAACDPRSNVGGGARQRQRTSVSASRRSSLACGATAIAALLDVRPQVRRARWADRGRRARDRDGARRCRRAADGARAIAARRQAHPRGGGAQRPRALVGAAPGQASRSSSA